MQRRLIIPAAVAMALLALLLFGFSTGRPTAVRQPRPDAVVPSVPRDAVQVQWPTDGDAPAIADAAGRPDPNPPVLPEPPEREPLQAMTSPELSHVPAADSIPTTKITGPWGKLPGIDDGFGPGGLVPVSSAKLDQPPRTRAQLAPVYPYEARVTGRAGEVWVEFLVDETGRVVDPHVLRSSDPLFEAPTLRAVTKWRFEPGRKDGRVVRFRMTVPVGFTVNP